MYFFSKKKRVPFRTLFFNAPITMKHVHHLIIIAAIALTAANCNTERSLIESSAYNYLDAMGNYRIAEAAPFASEQTQGTTINYILNNIMPNMDSSYILQNTPATIKLKGVRMINDSTARIGYRKDTPITHQNDSLTLVKRNGQWQAHVVIKVPKIVSSMLGPADADTLHKESRPATDNPFKKALKKAKNTQGK